MTTTIAIFGAAGNMGTRLTNTLRKAPEYRVLYVEANAAGQEKLRARGDEPTSRDQALQEADAIVLAVPDKLIGPVATELVSDLKPGTLVITLDPAAPHAGLLPRRDDISYFVTHPAHPPVFNDDMTMEARRDFFGSGLARQSIVCALMQGPEAHYAVGEAISRAMFGPILRSHRVTVEQMAILEPALSETVAATCITIIREAMDEAVRRGVPEPAARDFILGHVNIPLAIVFNEIEWNFSEGAKRAIEEGKKSLFQPDWKKVFEPDAILESVRKITGVTE